MDTYDSWKATERVDGRELEAEARWYAREQRLDAEAEDAERGAP